MAASKRKRAEWLSRAANIETRQRPYVYDGRWFKVRRSKVCEGNGSGAWRRRPWAQFIGRGQLVEGVKERRRRRPVELHQHVSYSKRRRRGGRLMRENRRGGDGMFIRCVGGEGGGGVQRQQRPGRAAAALH
jgi:hypothetical protein